MKYYGTFENNYLVGVYTIEDHEIFDPTIEAIELNNWQGWPARPFAEAKLKYINNSWQWEDPRTEAEILATQWASIKAKRDSLLTSSDWRVIKAADTGVPLAENWKVYRQILRDITTQSDPFRIIWPIAPIS